MTELQNLKEEIAEIIDPAPKSGKTYYMRFFCRIKIGYDQGLIESDPISGPENRKGKNYMYIHKTAIAAMHGLHSLVRFGN